MAGTTNNNQKEGDSLFSLFLLTQTLSLRLKRMEESVDRLLRLNSPPQPLFLKKIRPPTPRNPLPAAALGPPGVRAHQRTRGSPNAALRSDDFRGITL